MGNETATSIGWAIQMLEEAESVEEIQRIIRGSARAAVQAQGATVVWREGDFCHYADEDAMSPLWKGQRFPVDMCISGWAMRHRQTVAVPDICADSRIPQEAYRPTFVRSLLMVPIGADSPIGAIGVYWANLHHASDQEVATVERLADAAAKALARTFGSLENPVSARVALPTVA